MAISFKVVPRVNPQDRNAPPKYYAQVTYTGKRTLNDLADRIARSTTMGVADINGVLIALQEEIIDGLKQGASVELGNLCTFYPGIQSEGAESAEAFNAGVNIKRKKVTIRPKQQLKVAIKDASTTKVD